MQVDSIDDSDVPKVDKNANLEVCIVMKDEEGGYYFDILATKVDVKKYWYGVANFYVIQLLFDKVKHIYILWTRWGRIGDVGQF